MFLNKQLVCLQPFGILELIFMFSYQSLNHNLIIKSQILFLSLYVQDYIYVEVTGQN